MPETRAEQYFINGIQMLMVEFSNLDAAKYLETCIAVGQRALAENRLQAKKCVESFPQNRGQLVRCMVYSEAILQNALDKERLLQASRDYESWCVETTKQNWDDQIQAYYLAGVRVALIGGDSTRAASLLGRAKHFKAHPDQSRILKQLASGTLDASFEASMGTYFDFVRNPFTEKKVFLESNVQAFERLPSLHSPKILEEIKAGSSTTLATRPFGIEKEEAFLQS
jgi:hypothetical protein